MPEPPQSTASESLPDPYPIPTSKSPFRISQIPPGSKSLTNRALLLAALTPGETTIKNPLRADDTEVMLRGLAQLIGESKIAIAGNDAGGWDAITIRNSLDNNGPPRQAEPITLDLNNAGTATRFLTAACCCQSLTRTKVIIDGNARMRERPSAELVDNLRKLGAEIEYLEAPGCVPLEITPGQLQGTTLEIGATLSSQFISALLQIAPFCKGGFTIKLEPATIRSPTYIVLTLNLMQKFGARITATEDLATIRVGAGNYQPYNHTVEPDASSATYFLAAAAVCPGSVCTIEQLGQRSLQGDAAFVDVLQQMGAGVTFGADFLTVSGTHQESKAESSPPLRGIDRNMNSMPDAALTLAVCGLFAEGETIIRGIGNLRYKETDRLAALRNELTRCGATVEIEDDEILTIQPPPFTKLINNPKLIEIETYDDHRIAMAFAVAGLRIPNLHIKNPRCVNKTYPTFWQDWEKITTTA